MFVTSERIAKRAIDQIMSSLDRAMKYQRGFGCTWESNILSTYNPHWPQVGMFAKRQYEMSEE